MVLRMRLAFRKVLYCLMLLLPVMDIADGCASRVGSLGLTYRLSYSNAAHRQCPRSSVNDFAFGDYYFLAMTCGFTTVTLPAFLDK